MISRYVPYIVYIKYWQSKHIKDFFEMRICDETRTATTTTVTTTTTRKTTKITTITTTQSRDANTTRAEIENDLVACNSCKIGSLIEDVIIITEVEFLRNSRIAKKLFLAK